MVDSECYEGEDDEKDDDYYGDYVVLLDHFDGCWDFFMIEWRRRGGGVVVVKREVDDSGVDDVLLR